jgi:hypothetical protein
MLLRDVTDKTTTQKKPTPAEETNNWLLSDIDSFR